MLNIFLRKFSALLLTLSMVSAQTGVVFSFHYCKGELIDSSVYLPVDECTSESTEENLTCSPQEEDAVCSTTQMSDDCCATKVISLHADQNALQSKKIEVQDFVVSIEHISLTHCTLVVLPTIETTEVTTHKGRTVPLYIEFHQLIYYG
ncbi:hypothetical protein JCM31826_20840 [Thermaurantimonas aggregans]|uniref:Secreted protein n=1 Tax=Thermaurantimonas aggregans TaxID=2173829 RepID=A0A401XNN6_9FLAO|nr:hypothetical protein [Thermaurantimonas aggregans]MCX8148035.1 hypothetical protein [Thermaurantimonas aggregans]GCD78602.1 hypothetical protein JCM31826_20840 [Thermaurantimonas aggregans]